MSRYNFVEFSETSEKHTEVLPVIDVNYMGSSVHISICNKDIRKTFT